MEASELLENKYIWYGLGGVALLLLLTRKSTSYGTTGASEESVIALTKAGYDAETARLKEAGSINLRLAELASTEKLADLSSRTQIALAEINKPANDGLEIARMQAQLNATQLANQLRQNQDQLSTQRRSDLVNLFSGLGGNILNSLLRNQQSQSNQPKTSTTGGSSSGGSGYPTNPTLPPNRTRQTNWQPLIDWYTRYLQNRDNQLVTVNPAPFDFISNNTDLYDPGYDPFGYYNIFGPDFFAVEPDGPVGSVDSFFTPVGSTGPSYYDDPGSWDWLGGVSPEYFEG